MFRLNSETSPPNWSTSAILEGKGFERKIYAAVSVNIRHDTG